MQRRRARRRAGQQRHRVRRPGRPMPASSSRSSIQSAVNAASSRGTRGDHELVGRLQHGLPVRALHVVAGVDADHVVGAAQQLQHPAHGVRVEPLGEARVLLAGQHVVRAVGGVAQVVVEPVVQRRTRCSASTSARSATRCRIVRACRALPARRPSVPRSSLSSQASTPRPRTLPMVAAARTVAVVLCTPPFGLANASTRGPSRVSRRRMRRPCCVHGAGWRLRRTPLRSAAG